MGHGHSAMEQERTYEFRYRHGSGAGAAEGSIPIRVAEAQAPVPLSQVLDLAEGAGSIRLLRMLPRAARDQVVKPDETNASPPAVRISIDGPGQSNPAWLVANTPGRNSLTSFIAGWRYIAASNNQERDRLLAEFENETTRSPRVSISRLDGTGYHEIPAEEGEAQDIATLGCKIRVKRFLNHFGLDKATKKVVNQSSERVNPAVQVEIEHDGKTGTRWVFAKFPDYKMGESDQLPFAIRLDCPLDVANPLPRFVIATVEGARHELWSRIGNKHKASPLELEQKIPVPSTNFTFHLGQFVPSGRLVETYRPTDGKNSIAALEFEYRDRSGRQSTVWVEVGGRKVLGDDQSLQVELWEKSAQESIHAGNSAHGTP
jgi:hypothetical protein